MWSARAFLASLAFLLCSVDTFAQDSAPPLPSDVAPPPKTSGPPLLLGAVAQPASNPIADPRTADEPSTSRPAAFRVGSAGPYGVAAQSPSPALEPVALGRPETAVGWYAAVELGLVKPRITNRVTSGAPISPAFSAPVEVPIASLDWTVSPRFELGYHLPEGRGDVRLGYQLLGTSGSASGPVGDLQSRVQVNAIDIDYVSSEWLAWAPPELTRDLRLVCGVRIATANFNSAARAGALFDERFSSRFVGAGPRFGLEWRRAMLQRSVEAYWRLEADGILGQTRQDFGTGVRDGSGQVIAATRSDGGQSNGIAVLATEAGVAWRPGLDGRLRLIGGYHYEQWWNFGRTDNSNAELTVQGLFLRGEWRY